MIFWHDFFLLLNDIGFYEFTGKYVHKSLHVIINTVYKGFFSLQKFGKIGESGDV